MGGGREVKLEEQEHAPGYPLAGLELCASSLML